MTIKHLAEWLKPSFVKKLHYWSSRKKGKSTVVYGMQYGDESKGKETHRIAMGDEGLDNGADIAVRYGGGNNAGHTVIVGDETFKLNILPSGVIAGKHGMIGMGCVVDPQVLANELENNQKRLPHAIRLTIDRRAHLITPMHVWMDRANELRKEADAAREKKGEKIGTTARGIGPAYTDKAARVGLRVEDLLDEAEFRRKFDKLWELHEGMMRGYHHPEHAAKAREPATDAEKARGPSAESKEAIIQRYLALGLKLQRHVGDVSEELHDALAQGKHVVYEGAQGTFIDLNVGTYPNVTSSNTVSGGASTGTGMPPKFDDVVGVAKAYLTRVGSGIMDGELNAQNGDVDGLGEQIAKNGKEVGTTTGRARRVGWLDAAMLRQAHLHNGGTRMVLAKLDVLGGLRNKDGMLAKLKILTHYTVDGKVIRGMPSATIDPSRVVAHFEEHDGFEKFDSNLKKFSELPQAAQNYVRRVQELTGVRISHVGIGPDSRHMVEVPRE